MVAKKPAVEDLTLADLQAEADELRKRINRFRTSLGRFFVNKQEIIDLMVRRRRRPGAAAARRPARHRQVRPRAQVQGRPRHRRGATTSSTCSRGSPSRREIIGAIDISELREGRYIRRKEGKLPTARLAFLDEIFKSNSAILNILLTIINEQKFYQDGEPEPVPLRVLFAATNEIPEQGELAALKDRFVLKVAEPLGAGRALHGADRRRPAGRGVQGAEPEAVGRGALLRSTTC